MGRSFAFVHTARRASEFLESENFEARMMLCPEEDLQVLEHGIHVIDTGFHRPRFDASYLIVEGGRGAFVDTGTNFSVPRLLAALDHMGLRRDAVDYVIATHVHLDHAGGAGLLMRELPQARLVVHPRGARHMIDPWQLMAGARAVYGDAAVASSYGEVVGIDARRVVVTTDGMIVGLSGRPLQFLHTPGHALHHHCIWDERSRGIFTGDTFGVSYREFDTAQGPFILPTTTPVQFDPDAMRESVKRLAAMPVEQLYLTHYGSVGNVPRLATALSSVIDEMVALARRASAAPHRHAAMAQGLSEIYLRRLRDHGCTMNDSQALDLLAIDVDLNAMGLGVWLDRAARP